MKRIAPILVVPVILLAACSSSGGGGSGSASGSPAASPSGQGGGESGGGGGTDHPAGADQPILSITNAGGFVPPQFMATQTPVFMLFGDGRVVVQGAQTLEFPGPALPPLVERTLTESGIQAVIDAVADTNLFEEDLELRGAQAMVADASDTIFTLDAGGQTVTVTVYGLGALVPMEGMPAPEGVSDAEIEAHGVLQQLHDQMLMLDTMLEGDAFEDEGWQPYEPEALRLYVRDATNDPPQEGAPVETRDWLVDVSGDPAEFGEEQTTFGDGTRCGVVEGEAAADWLEALSQATQTTLWAHGDRTYTIMPRPLLPNEEATCPELIGA